LPERYLLALIDEIVQTTLKGKIRSQQQVYQMLAGVSPGTGEIFELWAIASPLPSTKWIPKLMSLKQAKATRSLRALRPSAGNGSAGRRTK